jgi:hypothetical protein
MKDNFNTGAESAYKIALHEKCRFHKTTVTSGSGECIYRNIVSVRPWPVEFESDTVLSAVTC